MRYDECPPPTPKGRQAFPAVGVIVCFSRCNLYPLIQGISGLRGDQDDEKVFFVSDSTLGLK